MQFNLTVQNVYKPVVFISNFFIAGEADYSGPEDAIVVNGER